MAAGPSPAATTTAATAASGSDKPTLSLKGKRGKLFRDFQALALRAGDPASGGGHPFFEAVRALVTNEFVNGHSVSPRVWRSSSNH